MNGEKYFKLNDGEIIIGKSDNESIVFDHGGFIVTNHRLIKVDKTSLGASSKVVSFNLENLDSIENLSNKSPGCIFISILLFIASFILFSIATNKYGDDKRKFNFIGIASIILSIILIIFFFITRENKIKLSSGRNEIILNVKGFETDEIQKLIYEIEQAKQNRLGKNSNNNKSNTNSNSKSNKERLLELHKLYEEGFITPEEFNEKRNDILKNI